MSQARGARGRLVPAFRRLTRSGAPTPTSSTSSRTSITRLMRNRPQLAVLRRLLDGAGDARRIRIYGVADGAESVSVLMSIGPEPESGLDIEGLDLSESLLADAATLSFTSEHFAADVDPSEYAAYLEPVAGGWRLRAHWWPFLHFGQADVLEAGTRGATAVDVVLCQNTLVGFSDDDARRAVDGLVQEVQPGGLLLVGGGKLDVVPAAVLAQGFEPVLDDVEQIHEAWEVQRRFHANPRPPWWALEPFDPDHPDGPSRYCTIFRRPGAPRPSAAP